MIYNTSDNLEKTMSMPWGECPEPGSRAERKMSAFLDLIKQNLPRYSRTVLIGALDIGQVYNNPPTFFKKKKKVGIFIQFEVFAWVMNAGWVLRSRLPYF